MKKAKLPYIIKNDVQIIHTPQGDVPLNHYRKVSLVCNNRQTVKAGDKVKVFAGKKIPLGTEATIKAIGRNKYENNPDNNPCLLLTIGENEVWTTGKNCYRLDDKGIEGKIRELDEIEVCSLDLSKEGYVSDKPLWYFQGKPGESQIIEANVLYSDHGLSIATDKSTGQKLFKEVGDEYVMVLDDWRSDTYPFLVMKKEYKPGNCVIFKENGVSAKFTDMNDFALTGYPTSKKMYEEYGKENK